MNNSEGIKRFEDLSCWQEARILVNMVYQSTSADVFRGHFGLKDQIQKASVSVMANIAEGFGAFSNIEFARFLKIASRSCLEVQSHLYVLADNDFIGRETFEHIYGQAQKCANFIRAFIRHLKRDKA